MGSGMSGRMGGRKLKIINKLEKEQKIYGGLSYREKINAKAKFQKEKAEPKYTESKALFAKKLIAIQTELVNKTPNFKKTQAIRKSIISVINEYSKQKRIKLPDSTLISLGTIEQRLESLRKSNQYDRYFENLDKEYTNGLIKLMDGQTNPEKITSLVNKVGVAITIHSEFLEKKINFEKKGKAKEE